MDYPQMFLKNIEFFYTCNTHHANLFECLLQDFGRAQAVVVIHAEDSTLQPGAEGP